MVARCCSLFRTCSALFLSRAKRTYRAYLPKKQVAGDLDFLDVSVAYFSYRYMKSSSDVEIASENAQTFLRIFLFNKFPLYPITLHTFIYSNLTQYRGNKTRTRIVGSFSMQCVFYIRELRIASNSIDFISNDVPIVITLIRSTVLPIRLDVSVSSSQQYISLSLIIFIFNTLFCS